jgi:hypothetical protein
MISIQLSQITVVGNWPDENINILSFQNQVDLALRRILDSMGFLKRRGYDVELIGATEHATGVQHLFGTAKEPIEIHRDLPDYSTILKQVGKHVPLALALADFREAIRVANQTSFFCFRAIESARHHFSDDDKEGWRLMGAALLVNRGPVDEIRVAANKLRHGKHVPQPWGTRKRHLEITHEIMRRFIWFLELGTLSPERFPNY